MKHNSSAAPEKGSSQPQGNSVTPTDGTIARRFLTRMALLLTRHTVIVTILLCSVTGLAAAAAIRIRFDFSIRSMTDGNTQLVDNADRLSRTFGDDESVLLVVLESTGRQDALDKAALTWQADAAKRISRLPHVEHVHSLPGIQREQIHFGFPPQRFRVPLIPRIPVDEETESAVRRYFESNQQFDGSLLSSDRKVAAIAVTFDAAIENLTEWQEQITALRQTLDTVPPPAGYRVHVSGRPAVRADIIQNLQADQSFLIPVAAAIYLVVLSLIFRRLSAGFLLLLVVGMGICWWLAVMVVAGQTLNLVSNVLPMLLLLLGVSNGVHILSRYAEEYSQVKDRREAVVRTMRHIGGACILAFLTTAIGFAGLWSARAKVMNEFATQAVVGLACLCVCVLVTLAAYLRWIRPPKHSLEQGNLRRLRKGRLPDADPDSLLVRLATIPNRVMSSVTGTVIRHPVMTMIFSAALVGGSLWSARNIHVNSYTVETFDDDHPTLQTMRLIEEKLGGLLTFSVVLESEESGRFLQPETIRRVADLQEYTRGQPEVLSARSYVDLLRAIDDRVSGGIEGKWPPLGKIGEERVQRSQRFVQRVADDVNYASFITPDASQVHLQFRVRDVGTKRTLELTERVRRKIREAFPAETGVTGTFGGDAYVNAQAMDSMIRDLFFSLAIASAVIFGVMALLFRSLRLGLVSAIPNLTPLVLTLGYMGLYGLDMNAGNVIVFTISLGIAVDDTIHFLYRYREERQRRPNDRTEAVRATLRGAGRPIILTSLLIVCGLSVLLFSDFVPTRRFAELTMVTIIGALLGDLLLLPASLIVFGGKPKHFRNQPAQSNADHPEDERRDPDGILQPTGPVEGL